jgi:hypothetical protein
VLWTAVSAGLTLAFAAVFMGVALLTLLVGGTRGAALAWRREAERRRQAEAPPTAARAMRRRLGGVSFS